MYRSILFVLFIAYALTGCMPSPYFQKEEAIPQNAWASNFKPSFDLEIKDTTVAYRPFFLIQHTQAYPYSNLWIWLYVKGPRDSVARRERYNIVLAEPNGKWLGRGMGEIYEQRMRMNLGDSINFDHAGSYKIYMEQDMRVNPLPEILHVGFRLEKTGARKNAGNQ